MSNMDFWWTRAAAVSLVAVGAYAWLVFVLRTSGKRTLSKLNAFDFAVTVAIGSTLSAIILDKNIGLIRGMLVLALLAILQFIVTKLSIHWPFFRHLVRSRPTLLVQDGLLFEDALRHERVTRDELAEAIRNQGHGRLCEIGAVVLETDGSFSVIAKAEQPPDLLFDVRRIGEPNGTLS